MYVVPPQHTNTEHVKVSAQILLLLIIILVILFKKLVIEYLYFAEQLLSANLT